MKMPWRRSKFPRLGKNFSAHARSMEERPRPVGSHQNHRRRRRQISQLDLFEIHACAAEPIQHPAPEIVASHRAAQPNRNAERRQSVGSVRPVPAQMFFDRVDPHRNPVLHALHRPDQDVLDQVPRHDDFAVNNQPKNIVSRSKCGRAIRPTGGSCDPSTSLQGSRLPADSPPHLNASALRKCFLRSRPLSDDKLKLVLNP